MLFLETALLGWIAALLLGAGVSVPYIARATAGASPYGRRLRPHYWIGFLILGASLLHAWFPMSHGEIHRYNQPGLLLATGALFVMFCQVALGIALRNASGHARRLCRRAHFWTMTILVGLMASHILLNRA